MTIWASPSSPLAGHRPADDPAYAFVWIWPGTIAWNSDRPWRSHLRFARDWVPVVLLSAPTTSRAGFADNGATPRERLYTANSSTTGTQSRAKRRWLRHGRSLFQAMVAGPDPDEGVRRVGGQPDGQPRGDEGDRPDVIATTRRRPPSGDAGGSVRAGGWGSVTTAIAVKVNDGRRHRPTGTTRRSRAQVGGGRRRMPGQGRRDPGRVLGGLGEHLG